MISVIFRHLVLEIYMLHLFTERIHLLQATVFIEDAARVSLQENMTAIILQCLLPPSIFLLVDLLLFSGVVNLFPMISSE